MNKKFFLIMLGAIILSFFVNTSEGQEFSTIGWCKPGTYYTVNENDTCMIFLNSCIPRGFRLVDEKDCKNPVICPEVSTLAVGPDGSCLSFPSSCLPKEWKKVDVCPSLGGSSSSSSSGGGDSGGQAEYSATTGSTSIYTGYVEEPENVTYPPPILTYEKRPMTEEEIRIAEERERERKKNYTPAPYPYNESYGGGSSSSSGGGGGGGGSAAGGIYEAAEQEKPLKDNKSLEGPGKDAIEIKPLVSPPIAINFSFSFDAEKKEYSEISPAEGQTLSIVNVTKDENNVVVNARIKSGSGTKEVKIERTSGSVTVVSQNSSAESNLPIKITGEGIYTDDKTGARIKTLPDAASEIARNSTGASSEKITIESENEKPVYSVEAKKEKKILGIIPVKISYNVKIDASNSEILSVKKPWWDFLAI
ncbi:MAG: PepSY domain-containing protein [Candidatus Aenigmarchaeota archaeon]|nr:PepSY domain-containing protein [Candidatus Aenigmarchaeota archaeon]